jgi:hypothetical protein
MLRRPAFTLTAIIAMACSGGSSVQPDASVNSEAGKGTTTASGAAVAAVSLSPRELNIKVGKTETLHASASDATGVAVTGNRTTWISRAPSVASVSDGGVVTGNLVGTVWVIGTIEQHSDSSRVTITSADAVVPPATPSITTFSPYFTVTGGDESKSEAVGNILIVATRTSDALGKSITPITAASATTEPSGHITMKSLPLGAYTFTATPPAGSAFNAASVSIGVPTVADPHISILLKRK